jgi:hypothetical protein
MKPPHAQLPIWRDANNLLVAIEIAVRRFPRYHKYALGSDLLRQAMEVCRVIVRAARPEGREQVLEHLVLAVEDLKISVQLAKELEAFASFGEFARIAEMAVLVLLVGFGQCQQFGQRLERQFQQWQHQQQQ